MLAEKLLLHVLIILMPIFIHNTFLENKRLGKSPYINGILYGIAVTLCLLFSFESYGLYWDLRYVPLVLAIIYGGPVAGSIAFLFYIGARTFLGGDALLLGYISGLLAISVPLLFSKKFMNYDTKKRTKMAVFIGAWPAFVMLFILVIHMMSTIPTDEDTYVLYSVLIFGAIQISAIWVASKLIETIIEREQMKLEITRAEKLNTLGELAASIAHEVRNPLTVVKGFLQLMRKQEKGENYSYLTLVLSELARAESIINDYLNFAKPQFEKIEEFKLSEVLTDIMLLLEPLAHKEGVLLEGYNLKEDMYVKTDRDQLKQAFVNLIKNAIEATSDGGKVTVSLHTQDGQANIKIKDTGKGMDKDELSRIGTLFYTTRDKGTGLGTTVSLRIIETMNGSISYKSEKNVGTEVTVEIPTISRVNK